MNEIFEILHEPLPHAIGWALVHSVWQGAVLACLLGLIFRLGILRSANGRYAAASLALASIVALLCVTTFIHYRTSEIERPRNKSASWSVQQDLAVPAAREAGNTGAPSAIPTGFFRIGHSPSAGWMEPVLPWLVFVWGTGVLLLAVRLLGCWAFTQHLRTRCLRPVETAVSALCDRLCIRFGVDQWVRVFESTAVDAPLLIGWMKPVVLLPASAISGLSPEQLEAILSHEIAHIRRYDYLMNLMQSLAETLLFFHPAVWWLSSVIRQEREHCCDDLVLRAGNDSLVYAEALALLEENRYRDAAFALSAADGSLSGRIQRILAGAGPAIVVGRPMAAMAGTLILALVGTVFLQAWMLHAKHAQPLRIAGNYGSDMPENMLRRMSGEWLDKPAQEVMNGIEKHLGTPLALPEEARNDHVTLRFTDARVCDAIDALCTRLRVGWKYSTSGTVDISPWTHRDRHLAWRRRSSVGKELTKEWFDAGFNTVTYRAEGEPLGVVLREIGNQMGTRILVPPGVANREVSVDFHGILGRDGLDDLLRPMGLDFRVRDQAELEVFQR